MKKNNLHAEALTSTIHDKTEEIGTTNRQRRKNENKMAIFMINIDQTNTVVKINFKKSYSR